MYFHVHPNGNRPVHLAYKPYFFSQRIVFFSHNKSDKSTFRHGLSAKRTGQMYTKHMSLKSKPIFTIGRQQSIEKYILVHTKRVSTKGFILRKEEDYAQFHLQECWSSFIGHLFSTDLLNICLCGHPYESSNMFGFEIWSFTMCGYHVDEKKFLGTLILFVFQISECL